MNPLNVAIVGCGNIAGRYCETLTPYQDVLRIRGFNDLEMDRARGLADRFGGTVYETLADVVTDPDVDVVVNLTIHHAHFDVVRTCLAGGKHVFSEKPITASYREAAELVAMADLNGIHLCSAPITYMGEAQQTAMKLVRNGRLGETRVAYAEVNWSRIESWHPNPAPFYDFGVFFDVAIYPLTLLTATFGAVRRVQAFGRVVMPDRKTLDGSGFEVTTPDFGVAGVEFESGLLARVTASFYVGSPAREQGSLELHGDRASLYLRHWDQFESPLDVADRGEPYAPVDLVREPFEGTEWSRGLVELADAIRSGRTPRSKATHAAHVIEIIEAIMRSIEEEKSIAVESDFAAPAPMEWAL
jgi:predicted dehydrogenase